MVNDEKEQVRHVIYGFINGGLSEWEWDDFISTPLSKNYYDGIRKVCLALPDRYPPPSPEFFCSDDGYRVLRIILEQML